MSDTCCVLFFPGSRPELLAKAVASGAGLVCIDLEDAVAPEAKDEARRAVVELLADSDGPASSANTGAPPRLAVRINHPSTLAGERDLAAIEEGGAVHAPLTVMVPKAGSRPELEALRRRLSTGGREVSLIVVVETAVGLAHVEEMACADRVSALLLGGLDLSVDLGCALDWEALLYARSRCVHAARLGGVRAIDTPFFDVGDHEGLRAEAERSRRLGFTAKAAIHPAQVPVIHEAFAADPTSVEHARRVLEAAEREGEGVSLVDGVMIDRPAVEKARRVVAESTPEEA